MAKQEKLKKPEKPFSVTGDRHEDARIAGLIMDDMGIPRLLDPVRPPVRMSPDRKAGFDLLMALLLPTVEELQEESKARRAERETE
ncbi:MAG: hypothetical protein WC880_00885 [Candidatus Paceibacterota bacterium]